MYKHNSIVEMNYDRSFFIEANKDRVWIPSDIDGVNPLTTLDTSQQQDDPEFEVVLRANQRVFLRVIDNRFESVNLLEQYVGYPIELSTIRNRGFPTSVVQSEPAGASIIINAWLGRPTTLNSNTFEILNGDGSPITAPSDESNLSGQRWVRIYTAPKSTATRGGVYQSRNLLNRDGSWIITRPGRQQGFNVNQPTTILNSSNSRVTSLTKGILKVNNIIIPDDVNRSKKFKLKVDNSLTQTAFFDTTGNTVIPGARHILRGTIYDRIDAGFDFTPTALLQNDYIGIFELDGTQYNMTQFIERNDNTIIVEFESV